MPVRNKWRTPVRTPTFKGKSVRFKTFGTVHGSAISTTKISRRCYINVATGTAYTVPAGAEISFNGSTWLSANGTTPAGARYWYCRGESSPDYETAVTLTPVLGGVNYPFVITTMADPATLNNKFPYTFPFELG